MKIGLIDYYLDEYHAHKYCERLPELSGGKVAVTAAYGQIANPATGMTSEQFCAQHNITLCACPEEVISLCDGLIVLAPDNCETHEALAAAALTSGKPVFIDKTFAPDLAAAERMVALAKKHNTPLCSFSALRYANEYKTLNRENISGVALWGGGPVDTYSVHILEPLCMMIKDKPKTVTFTGSFRFYTAAITFEGDKAASITAAYNFGRFSMLVQHTDKTAEKADVLHSDYFTNSITKLSEFLLTGKSDFDIKETLYTMALRDALITAEQAPGVAVPVPEISL